MSDNQQLEEWLDQKEQSLIHGFYPTLPSKETGIPLKPVIEYLLNQARTGRLIAKNEFRCPECGTVLCSQRVEFAFPISGFCSICDQLREFDPLELGYVFTFNRAN